MDSPWLLPVDYLAPVVKLFFSWTAVERRATFFFFFYQLFPKSRLILSNKLWGQWILNSSQGISKLVKEHPHEAVCHICWCSITKEAPQSPCLELLLHQISTIQSNFIWVIYTPTQQERGSGKQRAGIHREPGQSEDWQTTLGPDD